MKSFRLWSCAIVLTVMALGVSAQTAPDTYKVIKGNNGQSYLLAQASMGNILYTDAYFRIGTAYELDSVSGISLMIAKVIDTRIKAAIKGRNILYSSTVSATQIGFHFEASQADLDYVLTLLHDKVMVTTFDQEGVDAVKAETRADLDSIRHSEAGRTEMAIKTHLWGKDYKKLDAYGDKVTYAQISLAQFTSFHDKFFLPLNNMVVVTGTFDETEVLSKLQKTFDDFRSKEFNPELINRVIEFKPIINTVQLISRAQGLVQATVSYQGPGARQDRSATYCAYMLSALINDKNGRISKAMNTGGIKDLTASFDCNNFQGTLTITATVTDSNYNLAFSRMDTMIEGFKKKDYFTPEELQATTKMVRDEFNNLRKHTHAYMTQVAKYRFSNDENYFPGLADSIQSVTVASMQQYVNDYFVGRAGVKCLYADTGALAAAPAGQRYYALDESIKEVKFTYPQNVADIDTVTGTSDLERLIQWLRINPDIHVQINGFSDKSEYTKSYDTTIIRFIRNTPTFRKAMPDAIKVNYLRLEMMRAMKIAKAVYEAGIAEDRITGTSMTFTSDSDERAALNRKCTVTLEKIQPRMSLYEYHFGKKKADDLPQTIPAHINRDR